MPRSIPPFPASADGAIVSLPQNAERLNARCATPGFIHESNIDKGAMWKVISVAKERTAAEGKKFAALVKKALS